jgi:glucosamine-6-phosphate deaminase
MNISIASTKQEMGAQAAQTGAQKIREALTQKDEVSIILATGASQLEMLDVLVKEDIDWSRVNVFHLDEYIGISERHSASFRRYLKERFSNRLPTPVRAFHYIDGEGDPKMECRRLGGLISNTTVSVAFIGIGENGHIAFNDPPADFTTDTPYLVVKLDDACRRQQLGEGWFETIDDVPTQAISMSVRQIMKSETIICTVPDRRKSVAVKNAVEGPVTPLAPASILQQHEDCRLFLDRESASQLENVSSP